MSASTASMISSRTSSKHLILNETYFNTDILHAVANQREGSPIPGEHSAAAKKVLSRIGQCNNSVVEYR